MGHGSKWIRGPVLYCHGIHIGFRANQPILLEGINTTFIPGSDTSHRTRPEILYSLESDSANSVYTVSRGSRALIATRKVDALFHSLQREVQHTVASKAIDRLFVHAGAVAWGGKAILLPGRSGSGKSMLVREMIRAGAVYLSDEFAVLDDNGLVHPFARPLSIRTRSGKVTRTAGELGALTAVGPLPVDSVIFTNYLPGTVFEPSELTVGRAVLEIIKHTVAVRAHPGRALRIAATVAAKCQSLCSPRGDARNTARAVLQRAQNHSMPFPCPREAN